VRKTATLFGTHIKIFKLDTLLAIVYSSDVAPAKKSLDSCQLFLGTWLGKFAFRADPKIIITATIWQDKRKKTMFMFFLFYVLGSRFMALLNCFG